MKLLLFAAVAIAAFVIGTFGWSQIIGSLQNMADRGTGATLFTTILWGVILAAALILVLRFLIRFLIALLIGYGISLIIILASGKIR